ncbi:MAG: T9SS type A sorting domain-containing protein [Candidatus Kapaibacterium sp.]
MSILRTLRAVVALGAFLVSSPTSHAADFTLPDTISIAPGERKVIPLIGTIEAGGISRISVGYSPNVVRILSATGGAATSLYCATVDLTETVVSRTQAYVTLRCDYSRPAVNDTVCFLTIEGVGGPDRIGSIAVDSVFAQDTSYPVSATKGGYVLRTGVEIGAQRTDLAITGNYPNPFAQQTRIAFVVPKNESVRFTMRTIQGRLIRSWTTNAVAGENFYDLAILQSDAATGMYILELSTESGTAYHSMRVIP